MILILDAELVNPPTLIGSFRDFTFFASKYKPFYDVVLECHRGDKDLYYQYLKNYLGALDFIQDFVDIGEEKGLLISNHIERLPQIRIDRINPENMQFLLRRIGFKSLL